MDEQTRRAFYLALTDAGQMPTSEYVKALAESARGANAMRAGVIARVGIIARAGEQYDGSNRYSALLDDVTTISLIDKACGLPPVRLVYTRPDVDPAGNEDGA